MSEAAGPPRSTVERFEEIYAASSDPWDYASSEYERRKYAATLAAIGPGPYGRALEVGCSIGLFTQMLAPRCGELVAMDFSPRAIELARDRIDAQCNVEIVQGSFPEQAPQGSWELVVCSEVLYYLELPSLTSAVDWLEVQLAGGARVVVVSWRGKGETEPLRGDWVHDMLHERLGRWHSLDGRRAGYRLDRFDAHER